MREHGRRENPFGKPRGEPDRPLVEAGVAFAALYLAAFLPIGQGFAASVFASAGYQAAIVILDSARALLVLYLMSVGEGLAEFGLRPLKAVDLRGAALAAIGACAAAIPLALLFSAIGIANPVVAGLRQGPRVPLALAPLFLASSMATGYAEELFFRSYLMRRLGRAGLSPPWAAVVSSLIFGAAHGAQGIAGMATTSIVGLWFAWRWQARRSIHEIAIGHGLYDAAVFAVALYS